MSDLGPPLESFLFSFEDIQHDLALLPIAARRALDRSGLRLSLQGWRSLRLEDRYRVASAGEDDLVDTALIAAVSKKATPKPQRIDPVADPDANEPPAALSTALGPDRSIEPRVWTRLRALDRYALTHEHWRSVARSDPGRLAAAYEIIVSRQIMNMPGGARFASAPPAGARTPGPSWLPQDFSPGRYSETPTSPGYDVAPRLPEVRSQSPGASSGRGTIPPGPRSPTSPKARNSTAPRASQVPPAAISSPSNDRRAEPPEPAGHDNEHADVTVPDAPTGRREWDPGSGRRELDTNFGEFHYLEPEEISSHLTPEGDVHMVDVGPKPQTLRRAVAFGQVRMKPETVECILRGDAPKGEVLATARLAGIMAAKRTPELIPLCHVVALTSVTVQIDADIMGGTVGVTAIAQAFDRTGVEMEALVAASVSCLTIYDMMKGLDRAMVIGDVKLLEKSGGRTGTFRREGP
jgi:cyclic pyranopterin phosphate synthase